MKTVNEYMQNLSKMELPQLRVFASNVGVTNVSQKTKAQIIDEIAGILVGNTKKFSAINRNKPGKYVAIYDGSFAHKPSLERYSQSVAATPTEEYKSPKDKALVSGVVVEMGEKLIVKKFKYLDTADDCPIPAELIQKYELKENDVLEYAKLHGLAQIYKVNGKVVFSAAQEKFGNTTISLGKINGVFVDDVKAKRKMLLEIVKKHKVVLLSPEEDLNIAFKTMVAVIISGQKQQDLLNNFNTACSICSYYRACGQDCIFIVDEYVWLLSSLQNIKSKTNYVIDTLLSLQDYGTTIVCMLPTSMTRKTGLITDIMQNVQ